jgi:hypothetical protein
VLGKTPASLYRSAFLMWYKKMSFKQAIITVRTRRPIINPNNGFMRQLFDYEKELFGTNSVDPSLFEDDYG